MYEQSAAFNIYTCDRDYCGKTYHILTKIIIDEIPIDYDVKLLEKSKRLNHVLRTIYGDDMNHIGYDEDLYGYRISSCRLPWKYCVDNEVRENTADETSDDEDDENVEDEEDVDEENEDDKEENIDIENENFDTKKVNE